MIATQSNRSEPLNKQDGVNILGAVPLRRVPCSNTEGPGFDSPCTHQVEQATQTEASTHTWAAPVAATSYSEGAKPTCEQETSTVAPVSVTVEADIQECERRWRETHTLMADNAHPTQVQAAADAALTLTSQVWHFEPSDALEAVITEIVQRSPLTFARPEIGTMLRYMTTSARQWHTIVAQLWADIKTQR